MSFKWRGLKASELSKAIKFQPKNGRTGHALMRFPFLCITDRATYCAIDVLNDYAVDTDWTDYVLMFYENPFMYLFNQFRSTLFVCMGKLKARGILYQLTLGDAEIKVEGAIK